MSWDSSLADTVYQPNPQRPASTLDAQRVRVSVRDTNGGNTYGYLGYVADTMRLVYNIATHTTTVALDFVYIGNSTTATLKWRVPWNGITVPGSGVTLAGVAF